ncbi:MAG: hypothetical protein AB8B63_19645 [Granulosicoccus sp.]
MHADVLRMAVTKVVSMLDKSQIRPAIDQYRTAKDDQRASAGARLSHAGALLMEQLDELSEEEMLVVKCLHLEGLHSPDYWRQLVNPKTDDRAHRAEIIRLATRIMFASNHLPSLMSLLRNVQDNDPGLALQGLQAVLLPELERGEGALYIRLTDAGEKASDPDRIARAIDGIDMLYTACASVARKPTIGLRLDALFSKKNHDRDFRFSGEIDSISAVFAVIDSIPAAMAGIDPEQEIDLKSVIHSLPIFRDLDKLGSLGSFSNKELTDISDTMHQGALLTLESGVILIDEQMASKGTDSDALPTYDVRGFVSGNKAYSLTEERDEHYDRYLREREAMRQNFPYSAGNPGSTGDLPGGPSEEDARKEAVEELLKSIGRSKGS